MAKNKKRWWLVRYTEIDADLHIYHSVKKPKLHQKLSKYGRIRNYKYFCKHFKIRLELSEVKDITGPNGELILE